MLEQERQRIEQLTAGWDDPTRVDWGAEEGGDNEDGQHTQLQRTPSVPLKCTALYSYTVSNWLFCNKLTGKEYILHRHKIQTN